MKLKFFTFLLFSLSLGLQAQTQYFGLAKNPDFHTATSDAKSLMAVDYGYLLQWSIAGSVLKEADLKTQTAEITVENKVYKRMGGLGWFNLSTDDERLVFASTDYYALDSRDRIGSVIFQYDLNSGQISQTVIPGLDLLSTLKLHPVNPDLVAVIAMDNVDFNSYSFLFDLKSGKVIQKLMIGKGAVIPLHFGFSKDGKMTFVGYGSSSYGGGFEIYETESGKLIKKIPMQDHPRYFYEWKNQLIISGHSNSYFFNMANWTLTNTVRNMEITGVNYENEVAVGTFIFQDNRTKLSEMMHLDLNTKKVSVKPITKSWGHKYLPGTESVFSVYFKDYYKKEEQSKDVPTLILHK